MKTNQHTQNTEAELRFTRMHHFYRDQLLWKKSVARNTPTFNMNKKQEINIMQINLITLRYHGLWSTHLNGRKDKYHHIKLPLVCCALTFLWFCALSHLTNIILGKWHLDFRRNVKHVSIYYCCNYSLAHFQFLMAYLVRHLISFQRKNVM